MPKKPPRNNLRKRNPRTVQSAASLLRRVMQHSGLDISSENQLSASLLAGLPEALGKHVIRVVDKGQELVILTDSAAWAARLKLAIAGDPALTANRRTSVKVAPPGTVSR